MPPAMPSIWSRSERRAVAREGTPAEVRIPQVLREVFGIEADTVPDPGTGVRLCLPYELAGCAAAEADAAEERGLDAA